MDKETTVQLQDKSKNKNSKRTNRPTKPFPSYCIEDALKISKAIAQNNAGNPWDSAQIADAISMGEKSSSYYYLTTASRDYGMTTGTSRGKLIELTSVGRKIVYPENQGQEYASLQQAFFNIDIFKKVYDYYKGGNLPEKRFVCNTLQETFSLDSSYHDEFLQIFEKNMNFLRDKEIPGKSSTQRVELRENTSSTNSYEECESSTKKLFVIMPFSEKTGEYPNGYFEEVFNSLIVPAAAQTGYTAITANKTGSDIIHKTIVSSIYNAEIILADLTEHNPNVLFELGLAIAFKKKVAIMRAKGTNPIFDVDNSMRVLDYNSNLWKSTLEMDVARLSQHIESTANSNDTTYLDIFLN